MAKDNFEDAMAYMEEHDHEVDTILLEFDDPENPGEIMEVECDIIGVFDAEYNGKQGEYIAVSPVENREKEEYDVWIFGYVERENDEEFPYDIVDIEDDDELEFVIKEFDSLMDELEKEHAHKH